MKTIQEQNVFQFSSLLVAACLVGFATIANLSDVFDMEGVLFGISSLVFLLFGYCFNRRIKKLNGFLSSYATTFANYTFLVVLHSTVYTVYTQDYSICEFFWGIGVFLAYGYVLNLAISLIVYFLYKTILYFKN